MSTTESTPFAGESDQALLAAAVAFDPQESVSEPPAALYSPADVFDSPGEYRTEGCSEVFPANHY